MSSASLARRIPPRALGALVRAVYPRAEPELARLADFVPLGGTAVDVGGWLGPWTGRLAGWAAQVVTIEADPALAALLARTFPTVRVIHAACSSEPGSAELWVPDTGARSLAGTSSVEVRQGNAITVPRITLDSLGLADVRFIKLDIEGHELAALRGGAETIRRDMPVLLLELEARHQPIEPVVELLESWGYAGSVLPGREWVPLEGFPLAENQLANLRRVERSFVRHLIWPYPRYVNSVLFRPRR